VTSFKIQNVKFKKPMTVRRIGSDIIVQQCVSQSW